MTDEEKLRRLERTLDYAGNTHTVADVVGMIREGRAQFWSNGDGHIVTELHSTPLKKMVHYWLIFGELKHCLALEHDINPWAIEQGCSVATAAGRKGWERVSAPTGWRPFMPMYVKPLIRMH